MQTHTYTLTGVGKYEFETGGDAYSSLFVIPSAAATYYIEVSNGGDVWVNHPGLSVANPAINTLNYGQHACVFSKMRVRATANAGSLTIQFYAMELDR